MDDTGGSGNNRCGRHVGPAKSPFENLFLDTYALCNAKLRDNGNIKIDVAYK